MTDVPATVTVLLIEIAAATTALSIFVAAAGWHRWRKRRAIVVALVKILKQGGENRLARLQQLLMEMGIHDTVTASTLAAGILRLETKLYQHLVAGLIDITGKPLLNLDQHIEAFVNEFAKVTPAMIDSIPKKAISIVDSPSVNNSVTDGLARLERDNAELKSALLGLRTELQNLSLRPPTAPTQIVEAMMGEQDESSTKPAPNPVESTNLGVQELDFDLSNTMSPSSEPEITPSFNSEAIENPSVDYMENNKEPIAPVDEISSTQNTATIASDAAPTDDGIASMPDDWLNQPIDTTSDLRNPPSNEAQGNLTEPPIVDTPNDAEATTPIEVTEAQTDTTALDEIYTTASDPTPPTEQAEPEKAVIPVEIDPDAFLDSLLNDAKEESLNVIASTKNSSGGKASDKSAASGPTNNPTAKALDKKDTRPASSDKTNTNKQANASTEIKKKEPSANKSQLEAELEDLLS